MLCRDVIDIIEKDYSGKYAMEWDNVGLLAGRDNKEVQCIYIALDATDEVIDAAIQREADLLVTHHPLIFSGLKRVSNQDFIGNRLIRLIQHDISCYAMHTNYDVCRMAELSARKMGFTEPEVLKITHEGDTVMGIGKIADLESEITVEQCAQRVKEVFGLKNVRVYGAPVKKVKRAAICPGSGKSATGEAIKKGADVLITGDIGHHEGIDSVAQGLSIIDAGHYGVEHIFVEDMKQYFEENVKGVEVFTAPAAHPFCTI